MLMPFRDNEDAAMVVELDQWGVFEEIRLYDHFPVIMSYIRFVFT